MITMSFFKILNVLLLFLWKCQARIHSQGKQVAAIDIQAVEGKSVMLPCDVMPPGHDKVYMVFWFQDDAGIPLYSFDVRGKPLSQARHWSDPVKFGTRAYFRTASEPAQLEILDIRRRDEGVYRCRVDFRNTQTRSFRYNLTVIVPPETPQILDRWGRQLNGTVGPHEEGDDVLLKCRTIGGHPEPKVRWLVNGVIVDEEYEQNSGDVIENRLTWPAVARRDFDSIFTCQAINTNLIEPKDATVMLDLVLKPLTVNIIKTVTPLIADKRYEVKCETVGSRPPAIITWYKGKRQLKRTKDETHENMTISELSFVPTTEDDRKEVTCRAENPNVSGLYLEAKWQIDVVYPPIVSLQLGSTLNPDDIKEGDDVYFECHVRANPLWRKLTWLQDGLVLNHNLSARIIRSNQSLVIQKVTRQNAGKYICSAVNTEGETLSNELSFRVQYAPMCRTSGVMVVGASRGESLDIQCEVDADPPAKSFRWKFNNSGETLDVSPERYDKTSNGTVSILRYIPVSDLDYGTLTCWASNDVGHQDNPCLIQVVAAGKPFPLRNCSLWNQTFSSVEISCVPGFDGGLPQIFLLELYKSSSGVPFYNKTNLYEPRFYLTDLESDITFRIAVFAVNAKGRSHGVVLEEVTFKDAEKRTASDSELPISPFLGIVIGAIITIIILILLIAIRIRNQTVARDKPVEQKMVPLNIGGQTEQINVVKNTLHRSVSPREIDDRDPDVIPAKYGSPEGEAPRIIKTSNPDFDDKTGNFDAENWNNSGSIMDPSFQYRQYSNSVQSTSVTYSTNTRPKDLRLTGSAGTVTSSASASSTLSRSIELELNGIAIKEKLMAQRIPESCV